LWWVGDDPRLSATARRALLTSGSQLFLSAASAWEIAIKAELGKLRFNRELESFMADHLQSNRITALPVSIDHALYVRHLPNHHRDPFDRVLVAQAMLEGMAIVSGDRVLAKYDVEVLW
jgi:PIN domain nuclease of toxin-antitoxin system